MLEAVGKMDENIVEGLSNPFLMKVLPNYIHSPQKLLFVGQETKGWEKFQDTLHQIKDRKEELAYLQWMYEDFRNRRGGGGSPFWNITRKLFQALVTVK
ncbi:hypothetical protein [Brevibacillus nitrificans]|uniref:hypothetical protein n=1 Tax=Brevibacillus nitrificans TaxID=651560 RepID=UPI0028664291|nr:hypothetical protein [Brevibacillus nitrificans]MDR7319729.1 hypothetical protein [Brevibacillus nitrificans]